MNLFLYDRDFVMKELTYFQPNVAFHIKTSHLICIANQMTGFYMKYDTSLKCVKKKHLKSCLLVTAVGRYKFYIIKKLTNHSYFKYIVQYLYITSYIIFSKTSHLNLKQTIFLSRKMFHLHIQKCIDVYK